MPETISKRPTFSGRVDLDDGILPAKELERQGFSRHHIQQLTIKGELVHVGRGMYSRPDATVTENHTLAQVSVRVPRGIVCLLSALQYHNLTTQSPWQVWVMINHHARTPKIDYPPIHVIRSGGDAFVAGVEEHQIEGVKVQITSVTRTVVDCFKYRNKIGLAIGLEALKESLRDRRTDRTKLHQYARICRVDRVMQPYLEAFSI